MGEYIPMMERGLLEGLAKGQEKGIQIGQKKGIQIGREEGRQEEKQDIILNMLKNKIDISTIMKITKVTEDKILQIQKKLQVSDS